MRRLRGGLLAAAVLLTAGCRPEGPAEDAAHDADQRSIRTPTLAVSTRATVEARPVDESLTVFVTSPEGVASPGLDAAVSVLIERPDLRVVVVASASDGVGAAMTDDGHTMSGYPAHIVDDPDRDPLAAAADELGGKPDLVVVGLVEGAALGTGISSSDVAAAMRAATAMGVPVLAVTSGAQHGADLAGTGLILRSLLETELDALLEPGARVLSVPSCDGGLVRGPVSVPPSTERSAPDEVDCRGSDRPEPDDDVEAHGRGYASVVDLHESV